MQYEQLNLFDIFGDEKKPFRIDKEIALIELFAGYGSQALALERLGVPFHHHLVCEFDPHAINLYNAIHGTDFAPSDIRDITGKDLDITEKDKYIYVCVYSFPCQDISIAGAMKGYAKGSSTRSGLLWEVERLLDTTENLPDVLLMENVSQVHGKRNLESFNAWIEYLDSKGYTSYWKDMNSKNYGIPQNRNRCFMVSVLGNYSYEFPKEIPLHTRMMDYLDKKVEEKYYINSERAQKLIDKLIEEKIIVQTDRQTDRQTIDLTTKNPRRRDIANTISARTDRGVSARNQEGTGVCEY